MATPKPPQFDGIPGPNTQLTRESEIEYNRWHVLCEEAQAAGIDPNKPKFNLVFRAIAQWGESLVALRLTQTEEQRLKATSMANYRYQTEKKKHGL